MPVDTAALITLTGMALVTYGCRVAGYSFMRRRVPGPRVQRFLEAAPKTIFVALMTPALASGGIGEWAAALTAAAIMARSGQILLAMLGASVVLATIRALIA